MKELKWLALRLRDIVQCLWNGLWRGMLLFVLWDFIAVGVDYFNPHFLNDTFRWLPNELFIPANVLFFAFIGTGLYAAELRRKVPTPD